MLLKKAGMVVLGAAAGMAALSGTSFAGEAVSTHHDGHHKSHDRSHDRDRDRDSVRGGDRGTATATNGDCVNTGDQVVGVNCVNLQAPINQLGVLSTYNNGDSDRSTVRSGEARTGGERGTASASNGNQVNTGNQLVGLNNISAQLPINQLGILSTYNN